MKVSFDVLLVKVFVQFYFNIPELGWEIEHLLSRIINDTR